MSHSFLDPLIQFSGAGCVLSVIRVLVWVLGWLECRILCRLAAFLENATAFFERMERCGRASARPVEICVRRGCRVRSRSGRVNHSVYHAILMRAVLVTHTLS